MQDFYKIIADRQELGKFLDWLPSTKDSEQYYVTLLARRKYFVDHPALKSDKTMISRWTSTKERLFNKIEQKETKVGTYLGHNDIAVPQESLACYITPSPRDFKRVAYKTIQTFAEKLGKAEYINPRQEVMNIIQTSPVKDKFHVFDIDSKDPAMLVKVQTFVGDLYNAIETRGGYHIIINPHDFEGQTVDKNWYQGISKLSDVRGDALCPIPGTFQGNFIPRLIHISAKHKQSV